MYKRLSILVITNFIATIIYFSAPNLFLAGTIYGLLLATIAEGLYLLLFDD